MDNCLPGKLSSWKKYPFAHESLDNCSFDICPLDNYFLDNGPLNKYPFDNHPSDKCIFIKKCRMFYDKNLVIDDLTIRPWLEVNNI